jgi:hypothetical protein
VWFHVVIVATILHRHDSNPLSQQHYVHEEILYVACRFKAYQRCNGWTLQQEGKAIDIITTLLLPSQKNDEICFCLNFHHCST